jgi:cytoskeleton protein RodZ
MNTDTPQDLRPLELKEALPASQHPPVPSDAEAVSPDLQAHLDLEEAPPEPQISAGEVLRQAREASGKSIQALAHQLRVPVKKLEALEAGRYEELPDMAFVRALSQSLCRTLNLDSVALMALMPKSSQPSLNHEKLSGINDPFFMDINYKPFSLKEWLIRPTIVLTLVLLAAALFLYFMPMGTGLPLLSGPPKAVDKVTPVTPAALTSPVQPVPANEAKTAGGFTSTPVASQASVLSPAAKP